MQNGVKEESATEIKNRERKEFIRNQIQESQRQFNVNPAQILCNDYRNVSKK